MLHIRNEANQILMCTCVCLKKCKMILELYIHYTYFVVFPTNLLMLLLVTLYRLNVTLIRF